MLPLVCFFYSNEFIRERNTTIWPSNWKCERMLTIQINLYQGCHLFVIFNQEILQHAFSNWWSKVATYGNSKIAHNSINVSNICENTSKLHLKPNERTNELSDTWEFIYNEALTYHRSKSCRMLSEHKKCNNSTLLFP